MDLGLPDMDGLDLIREIRTEFEWIRIIVISGAVADDLLPLVRAAGADAAQSKPVDLNRLRKVVNQLVDSPLCWTSAG
jgi:CheY-like chemotaxis protein